MNDTSCWYSEPFIVNHNQLLSTEDRMNNIENINEQNINMIATIHDIMDEQHLKIIKLQIENNQLKKSNEENLLKINKIENDWKELVTRLLETEVFLERTKNILVRKHISFPFISDAKL